MAAWLLSGEHANALGDDRGDGARKLVLPHLLGLSRLLSFRGQEAKYDTIIQRWFRRLENEPTLHLRVALVRE